MEPDSLNIICPACVGLGYVALPDKLHRAWKACSTREGRTAREIMLALNEAGDDVRFTATCNRLKALEELGLVGKVRECEGTRGAWHLWRRLV